VQYLQEQCYLPSLLLMLLYRKIPLLVRNEIDANLVYNWASYVVKSKAPLPKTAEDAKENAQTFRIEFMQQIEEVRTFWITRTMSSDKAYFVKMLRKTVFWEEVVEGKHYI
jgi:hypothetical protein